MSNQFMFFIEKVIKWILLFQEGGGIDRYIVKVKRKFFIQKVLELSVESFNRESELFLIVFSFCGNFIISIENLLY